MAIDSRDFDAPWYDLTLWWDYITDPESQNDPQATPGGVISETVDYWGDKAESGLEATGEAVGRGVAAVGTGVASAAKDQPILIVVGLLILLGAVVYAGSVFKSLAP